jgi:hypothetical protein
MHTATIHQHRDQVPLMNGITANPHSVVKKRDLSYYYLLDTASAINCAVGNPTTGGV